MYRLLINVAALASTCWIGMSHALAEHRMALVIGNSNYATVTALPNPASDARAMAKFLNSAGFQVLQAPDLSQTEMRRTIGDFASMVADKGPDTVALVFYAGHGL
ncbi:MAG: caspase family protein, partial [Xanthobacteraceae bacterium]